MPRTRIALFALLAVAVAAALVSGGDGSDPRTPPATPGLPSPFLGTAVAGGGGITVAVDAYGDLVDLRVPGPAGVAQIELPPSRLSAGTVPATTGIVPAVATGRAAPRPLWHASRLRQRYLARTNVIQTSARLGPAWLRITDAVAPNRAAFARRLAVDGPRATPLRVRLGVNLDLAGDSGDDAIARSRGGIVQRDGPTAVRCAAEPAPTLVSVEGGSDPRAWLAWSGRHRLVVSLGCSFDRRAARPGALIRAAASSDRAWLARARPLGGRAPAWARGAYSRSLLVLRALTDRRSGAAAAGARQGWAYVWPRDAAATAIALADAGYRPLARRIVAFLAELELDRGARFDGAGSPVSDGRAPQGDAGGWIRAAARAAAVQPPAGLPRRWRDRADYGERSEDSGEYLANAIAAGAPRPLLRRLFETERGLVRTAGEPDSGLESAAAWAVRPFSYPNLGGLVRQTLTALLRRGGAFGIRPSEDFPGEGAWSAPTAWSAWSLAALGGRGAAGQLLEALRRARTAAGTLPERVDEHTGIATSTTPLAWSHAFLALALRELYPGTD